MAMVEMAAEAAAPLSADSKSAQAKFQASRTSEPFKIIACKAYAQKKP
jgi:hypothetical protein